MRYFISIICFWAFSSFCVMAQSDYYARQAQNYMRARTQTRYANDARDKAQMRLKWANDALEKANRK